MKEEKQYTRKELDKKLTDKEKAFSHNYIIDWNGARSARDAGYSHDTAKEQAVELKNRPHIAQYINFIKEDIEKESGISKIRNLKELAKMAYSNIAILHDTWIELKDFEKIKIENPDAMAAIESIDTKIEQRVIKTTNPLLEDIDIEVKYVKIRLFSKIASITEINKMMGYHAPSKLEAEVTEKKTIFEIGGKKFEI